MRSVDPAALTPAQRHALFTRLTLPQAIAVISTVAGDGGALVAPLGYCVPLRGQESVVAVTVAAVRGAGDEPELVRAAALASGELVANLTTADLAQHLRDLDRAPRDPATGSVRWPLVASHRVGAPSLGPARARLECRVRGPGTPDGARPAAAGGSAPAVRAGPVRPGPAYALIVDVVCVVADEELIAPVDGPAPPPADVDRGRAEFPWFFGPADGSVVGPAPGGGADRRGSGRPVIERAAEPVVIDQEPE